MNIDDRLLRQARHSRLALALTVGLGLCVSVLTVLQAGLISRVISRVFQQGWDFSQVSGLMLGLLLVFLFRAGLVWSSDLSAHAVARRVKSSLRLALFQHLLDEGPALVNEQRSGELSSVLLEGVEALDAYYSQYLPQLALAALIPFTYLLFIFPLDWLSGLVLLVTAPLIPIFMVLIGSKAQSLSRRQWQTLSRMNAYFLDVLQGLTTLKIFGRSRSQIGVISQVSERYRRVTMSVLRVTFLSALALEMVATLSTAVVAVEIGLRLLTGRLLFEQALFVLLLAPEFYLPLRLLGARFHAGMSGVAAGQRIFEVLNDQQPAAKVQPVLDRQMPPPPSENNRTQQLSTRPPAISFKNVSFSYPSAGEQQALRGVSFDLPPGTVTALVGLSGAGKSTIAHLLLRFIQPDLGQILVNGQYLAAISPTVWRESLAWVSQNPYLFQGTIADNIRLANQQASLEQVIQAAQAAQAHEFITGLADGYDTRVSERGANLSAGQAQRIALARAFLKNAPLVILDEPTASLDPETEDLLDAALQQLLKDRTVLIIAHRLNTTISADQVVVLQSGNVVENGTPAQLLAQAGLFWKMVNAAGSDLMEQKETSSAEMNYPQCQELQPSSTGDLTCPMSENDAAPQDRSIFLRLLKMVHPFKAQAALSVLVGFATIASGIGLLSTSAYLISMAALQPSIAELQLAIVGVRFFGISRGIFRYLERYLSHQVTFQVLGQLRVNFYRALEPLAPARLLHFRSGDLLARISGDIESLENFYVRALAPPLTAILVALLSGGLLWYWAGPLLAGALWGFMLAAGLGVPLFVRSLSFQPGRDLVENRAVLSAALVDGIQGIAELLVFSQEARQVELLNQVDQAFADAQQRLTWIGGIQAGLVSLFSNLGLWMVLGLAIPQVVNGHLDGVYLAVLALAALASFEAVLPLPMAAQVLESNLQAARRLFEIVDARPEIAETERLHQSLPAPEIMIDNLRFSYPNISMLLGDAPVAVNNLEDIDLALPQGKKLAVVGPSGAGKSTLVGLLLRFWEFQSGEFTLGGQDIHLYPPGQVRSLFGVVSQNAYLFNASLRDNLLIARPNATQAELEQAVEMAQLAEFVQTLPNGWDTWLGEQGVHLSAGQRQRLAIARAALVDAPILLLDEPTANLDALTEQALLKALRPLFQRRSVLYISHRLVGMEWMDEIIVLRRGRIIERGLHEELLDRRGYYSRLYYLQRQFLPGA